MNLPGSTFTYKARTVQALAMVVIIIIKRLCLLHCVVLIEYPRSLPGSSSLRTLGLVGVVAIVRYCSILPEADQILDLGNRLQWICSQPHMIPIEGARVEEEEETFSKARSMSPNLYR